MIKAVEQFNIRGNRFNNAIVLIYTIKQEKYFYIRKIERCIKGEETYILILSTISLYSQTRPVP